MSQEQKENCPVLDNCQIVQSVPTDLALELDFNAKASELFSEYQAESEERSRIADQQTRMAIVKMARENFPKFTEYIKFCRKRRVDQQPAKHIPSDRTHYLDPVDQVYKRRRAVKAKPICN